MLVFLDFEASSLGKKSYPIEVGWVFEDGVSESHLIRPAPDWTEWNDEAEAVHGISRATLIEQGEPHEVVARRMVDQLAGHDLLASAPSWDGKWLSVLLRAAGLPRHTLRLRDSDEARCECAVAILASVVTPEKLPGTIMRLLTRVGMQESGKVRVHRALADAEYERARWLAVRSAAEAFAVRQAT